MTVTRQEWAGRDDVVVTGPAADAPPRHVVPASGPPPGPPGDDLLERSEELDALVRFATGVRDGDGGLLVVEGPGGIGKTALVGAFVVQARAAGLHVAAAAAAELERDLPWTVVRALYEATVPGTSLDPHAVDRLLDHALGVTPEPPQIGSALVRLRRGVLGFAVERPLVFVVDDAHWADPTSLRALHYLVRRIGDAPVGVVVTRRTSETAPELDELVALAGERRLLLHPVSPSATAEVLRARLDAELAPDLAAAAHEVTSGNPLLVRELARELRGGGHALNAETVRRIGPRTVARSALTRIDRLMPGAAAVARAVAVLGTDATTARVAAVAGVSEAEAADQLGALVEAELLADGARPCFEHPLIATALYQHMPSGRRSALHGRAAEVLDADGVSVDAVATHLLLSEPSGHAWAVDRLRRAARRALRVGGTPHAVRLLHRALDEAPPGPERGRIMLELGQVEAWELQASAAEHLELARRTHPEPAGRVAATIALVRLYVMAQRWQAALQVVGEALGSPDLPAVPEARDDLLAERMVICTSTGIGLAAHVIDAERLAEQSPESPAGRLAALHLLAPGLGRFEPVETLLARAGAAWGGGALLEPEHALESLHWSHLAWHAALLGDHDLAVEVVDRAGRIARARGSRGDLAQVEVTRAWLSLTTGRVEGLAPRLQFVRAAMEWTHGVGPVLVDAALAQVLVRQEQGPVAVELLKPRPPLRADGDAYSGLLELARAEALLRADQAAEAEASARRVGEMCAARGLDSPVDWPWRGVAVRAMIALGRRADAERLARDDLARAERSGHPRAVGRSLLGVAAAIPAADRLDLVQRAHELLEPSPYRADAVEARIDLAAALRRAGRLPEARQESLSALAEAGTLGDDRLAQRARREAQLAGSRPRRQALLGPAALTGSEREVARLAAQGLTNREVAARLVVSVKTVEKHLSSAFRKLGVEHRASLAEALGDS